jgi:hypothetical protein
MAETDFTAMRARQLLAEHDAGDQADDETPEAIVARVQAGLKRGTAVWDDELQDVIVDLSGSRGR